MKSLSEVRLTLRPGLPPDGANGRFIGWDAAGNVYPLMWQPPGAVAAYQGGRWESVGYRQDGSRLPFVAPLPGGTVVIVAHAELEDA